MKVKVGQWVRLSNGIIEYVDYLWRDINSHYYLAYKSTIGKVADDPRELIQVGDLIEINNALLQYHSIIDPVFEIILREQKHLITKILTPNSNGSVYTLQWEAE